MNSYYGLLQAFADALKLIIKEYVAPTQSNILLFFFGPMITLFFALLGFSIIPFGPFSLIAELKYGILFILAVSSVATYGILLAG
jgi:NADH-ubiquinone oxidoreductase chain 1